MIIGTPTAARRRFLCSFFIKTVSDSVDGLSLQFVLLNSAALHRQVFLLFCPPLYINKDRLNNRNTKAL